MVSGQRRDLQRCRRGPQQQTSCGDQTFLRFSHLRCHGNRPLSHVGSASGTGIDPQFLLSKAKKKLAPEEWHAFIPNAHAGYISWEEYQENQKRLQENTTQYRCPRQRTPPREGPALIQGMALCGRCGRRMQVQYHERRGHLYADYVCGAGASRYGLKQCLRIPGRDIDRALGELLLATVSPLNLEVALAIERE